MNYSPPLCLYTFGQNACQFKGFKEPFSPHGRGLVTIVYVVKRSFQFDMKQDTCHVKGRKFTCKVWRTSWKRALNLIYSQCCEEDGIGLNHQRRRKYWRVCTSYRTSGTSRAKSKTKSIWIDSLWRKWSRGEYRRRPRVKFCAIAELIVSEICSFRALH